MTFYILLSTVAILTAVVGCALIWGYDIVRAREIERTVLQPAVTPEVSAGPRHAEVQARHTD